MDRLVLVFDRGLRTVFASAKSTRPIPGGDLQESELSVEERQHVGGLMRVNHVGEVCAQALYQGQALTSRDGRVRKALESAANEETDHLAWAEQRIADLGGRTSLLNPLWYGGALAIGVAAGICGDRWSLAFLAETERQVEAHLESHLSKIPSPDEKTRRVVSQMKTDEAEHARMAMTLGAANLPVEIKAAMRLASRLMTTIAYRI